MRERFCRVCNGWHQLDAWPHNCMPERNLAQSELPAPRFISDTIEVQSMLDGRHYSSKSQLRRTYKAAGVEEVGNSKPNRIEKPKVDRKSIRDDLRRTYAQMK